jgi:hypothetical protein
MKLLKRIFDEAVGLFVDDGAFAGAILIWLAVVAALVRFAPGAEAWAGPVLFVGLAGILVESAVRRARKG